MQNSSRPVYPLYASLQPQPIEPLPNWSWNNRIVASNKGAMGIGGLLSGNARHGTNAEAQLRHQMHSALTMDTQFGMNHNGAMGHHVQQYHLAHSASMHYPHMNHGQQPQMMQSNISPVHAHSPIDMEEGSPKPKAEPTIKSFTCTVCAKAFARRSDLARHERIHSGDRPHKCDYPNCGKEFIQRSALTVHSRVHTGEKPHKCEICNKPFSDSSSLARHRRIHSGKRPYKCPFANCQKTFTRRTTLTRHQAHHTGPLDQVNNGLHSKFSIPSQSSAEDAFSDTHSSRNSTGSPSDPPTISPNIETPQLSLHRQSQDFKYMPQNQCLPPHMRTDYNMSMMHTHNPSVSSANPTNFSSAPQTRGSITSNPTSYGPPQPLEPPANGTASGAASPHMSAMGWGSPNHGGLPSPTIMDFGGYPDPTYGGQQMFFPGNGMRRPQSTEPEDWSLRSNRNSNNHNQNNFNHMHMSHDWNMPMPDIKQERAYAM